MIQTARFFLRPLTVSDASDRYLGWFSDAAAQKYIDASRTMVAISELRDYIRQREGRSDVLFLGVFETATGAHIGNIKYEPVDTVAGFAVMGVLIGDRQWRGKGVTGEVLRASAEWLRTHRGIRQIVLGVSVDNVHAIRAYEAVGFAIEVTPHLPPASAGSITMVWRV